MVRAALRTSILLRRQPSDAGSVASVTDPSQQRWARVPGWTHRVDDDEVLLCNAELTTVSVGGAATPVFEVLEAPATPDEIRERVAQRWPDRPLEPDAVAHALEALAEHGVIAVSQTDDHHRCWGRTDDGEVLEIVVAAHLSSELASRWPPVGLQLLLDEPATDRQPIGRLGLGDAHLFVPDDLSELGHDPDEVAWGLLEQSLTATAATRLNHLVAVHSAVFAWRGEIILVPALSGAGKSTLTLAAHRAGAKVLSDEFALIDPDTGLVTGWRRPARIRRADGTGEDRIDIAVDSEPLPVALVAALTYERASASDWHPMTSSETVLEILANTLVARSRPDDSLDAAAAVSRRARGVKGTRGDADRAVVDLFDLVAEAAGSVPE